MPSEPPRIDTGEIEILSDPDDAAPPSPPGSPPSSARVAVGVPDFADALPEDQEFIRRCFAAVKHVDFRSPPPPPPRGLSGFDKKIHDLRENVRRLERDLARVGHVWAIKQRRVDEVENIIDAERARREQSDHRYAQIKEQATRAAAENRAELAALTAKLQALEAVRQEQSTQITTHSARITQLEEEVQREQNEKQSLSEDFRAKMGEAEAAFNALRQKSGDEITRLQGVLTERDQALKDLDRERNESIATLKQQNEQALDRMNTEHHEIVASATQEHSQALADLSKGHAEVLERLKGDHDTYIQKSTEDHEEALAQLKSEHENRAQESTEGHENALKDLTDQYERSTKETEERQATTVEKLEQELGALRASLEENEASVKSLSADLENATTALEKTTQELESSQSALSEARDSLNSAQSEHKTTESRLATRLSEREETLKTLTEEMAASRKDHTGRIDKLEIELEKTRAQTAELNQAGADKNTTIGELQQQLDSVRAELTQAQEDCRLARTDLAAAAELGEDGAEKSSDNDSGDVES